MSLTAEQTLALALDPALLFELRGLTPDPWQCQLLRSKAARILLNCCRQAGKSTTVAALALHTALFTPESLVLLLSRSQRQSSELFRKVIEFYQALVFEGARTARAEARSALRLELTNGSRIVSLPGHEETVRSYSGVRLLIIDEAARVPTDLYRAVRPMLAVSRGRLVILSTPFGRRGFFYRAWEDKATDWQRFQVRAEQVRRIGRAFLDEELRTLGQSWFNQEYGCSFEAREGLVYPEFPRCVVRSLPAELSGLLQIADSRIHNGRQSAVGLRLYGGIDFGFRNPFAAVWGVRDQQDVLWIFGEHYARRAPLSEHAAKLPRAAYWYADPAGASDIAEMHCGGFVIRKAKNALETGIAAVTARIQTGRLKVLADRCPHLLAEARLYRYPSHAERGVDHEKPIDEHNHALGALRYLVSRLDHRFMVRARRSPGSPDAAQTTGARKWLSIYNEALWTPLNY
jgi:Terminase large subunit, T4likevirus-type, N-terminal/Terminase RNaseH-like domain